jgi:ADP-heptose:LPS heptosyltransferase/GT2 family glycosyltransferase
LNQEATSDRKEKRILVLRPDTLGDLVLFSASLKALAEHCPETRIEVLTRASQIELARLLVPEVTWHGTSLDPYSQGPAAAGLLLEELESWVRKLQPDIVLAACSKRTWLDFALACAAPTAKCIALGSDAEDPFFGSQLRVCRPEIAGQPFKETIAVSKDMPEWQRGFLLISRLLGREVPAKTPSIELSAELKQKTAVILGSLGLSPGSFVCCAAAGYANVRLKTWPSEKFAVCLKWLCEEKSVPVLLVGHESEKEYLIALQNAAGSERVKLWLGGSKDLPVLAALLGSARFYFGNDTGAMHLAAACGQSILALFGGGTWPRFRPATKSSIEILCPLPCFSCDWDCCFGSGPCVKAIDEKSVIQALKELLGGQKPEQNRVLNLSLPANMLDGLILGAQTESKRLSEELRKRQSEFEMTVALAAAKDLEITSLSASAEERNQDSLQKERSIEQKEAELSQLSVELRTRDSEIERKHAEIIAKQEALLSLSKELRTKELGLAEKDAEIAKIFAEMLAQRDSARALLQEVQAKDAEITAKDSEITAKHSALLTLSHDLKAKDAEITTKHGALLSLGEELKSKDAEITAKQAALLSLSDDLKAKDSEITAKHSALISLGQDLKAKDAEITAKQAALLSLSDELKAKDLEITAKHSALISLGQDLKAKDAEITAKQAALLSLSDDLKAKDSEITAKHSALISLGQDLKAKDAEITAKQAALLSLSDDLKAKDSEITAKHSALVSLSQDLKAKDVEIFAKQEALLSLSGDLLTKEQGLSEKDSEIAKIFAEMGAQRDSAKELLQEVQAKDLEIKAKQVALLSLSEDLLTKEKGLSEKDSEIAKIFAEMVSQRKSAQERYKELQMKDAEIKTLNAACGERLELIVQMDKDIKALLEERTRESQALQQALSSAKKEAKETKELYTRLSPDATQWAKQLAEAQGRITVLEQEGASLSIQLQSVQNSLREREVSLGNISNGLGTLELHKYYQRHLQAKEEVLQMLNRVCQEREVLIRRLSVEATTTTARLGKLATALEGWWTARITKPIKAWYEKKILNGYWMQLGQLHQYSPRRIDWDTRLASTAKAKGRSPRIGIVTPSYNQAAFLERTIQSILGQSYPNLRYVIQDGGSKDGSAELIKQNGDRLYAWESAKDAGQSDAIRKGFAKLSTELGPDDIMAWVNSDDLLAPGSLHFVAQYFEKHPEVDVIYGHRIIVDALDREIGRWVLPIHDPESLRWFDLIPQETLFWRKRVWDRIGGLDPSFHFALDWDLLLRIQESGVKLHRLPYFLGVFRVHDESKTSALINSKGIEEMSRLRQRMHGASFDHTRLEAELKKTRLRGALCSRLHSLGIRH